MTHEELKQQALSNNEVKNAYDGLGLEFQLLDQMLLARKQAGLNQTQVAELMGTKQTAVARLESSLANGKQSPSLSTISKYANAVGCDVNIKLIHR